MSTRRSALSIAVLDKDVYVIGGYDGNASLSSVEVYVKACMHILAFSYSLPRLVHVCIIIYCIDCS